MVHKDHRRDAFARGHSSLSSTIFSSARDPPRLAVDPPPRSARALPWPWVALSPTVYLPTRTPVGSLRGNVPPGNESKGGLTDNSVTEDGQGWGVSATPLGITEHPEACNLGRPICDVISISPRLGIELRRTTPSVLTRFQRKSACSLAYRVTLGATSHPEFRVSFFGGAIHGRSPWIAYIHFSGTTPGPGSFLPPRYEEDLGVKTPPFQVYACCTDSYNNLDPANSFTHHNIQLFIP